MGNRNMQYKKIDGYHEGENAQGSVLSLFSPECCKEKIYYRLVSMKMNEGLKDKVPSIPFLDMLVTFHVLLQSNEEQICSLRITNEMAGRWGMDTKTLYSLAKDNTSKLFPERIYRLRDMVDKLCGAAGGKTEELKEVSEAIQKKWYMEPYVLTNSRGINGAAAVLYRGILRRISDGFNGDCYVLPSSIHELLVLPKEAGLAVEGELRSMVREVNGAYVSREDFLSNQIYCYDRKRDIIKICPLAESE